MSSETFVAMRSLQKCEIYVCAPGNGKFVRELTTVTKKTSGEIEYFFCFVFSLFVVFWSNLVLVFVRFWCCVVSPFASAILLI